MKPAKQTLTIVFIVSMLLNSLILLAQWYALSPSGTQAYLQSAMVLLIPVTLTMLVIPVFVLALALPYKRKRTLVIVGACTIYVASGFFWAKLSMIYREAAFDNLAQRSETLVAAIERYLAEQGVPPEQLQNLVPGYLPSIPGTSMGAYPEYSYQVNKEVISGTHYSWVLYVEIPKSGLGKRGEKFMYQPNQEYPIPWEGDVIRRVGKWVYVSDK